MFHVDMRMSGMHSVREFNLSEQRLWLEFLAPLMAGQAFTVEGHEFIPRETRLKVYEGPELRPDQLGMGRGWQNVERTATDVTARVLARAREHVAAGLATPNTEGAGAPVGPASTPSTATVDLLRERLNGRLSAGPIGADELLAIAAELIPAGDGKQRAAAISQAVWMLLERKAAQLAPSAR